MLRLIQAIVTMLRVGFIPTLLERLLEFPPLYKLVSSYKNQMTLGFELTHFCNKGCSLCSHRINDSDKMIMHHYAKPIINLSNMSNEVLIKKQREFYKKTILNHKFIISHIAKFHSYHIHNWRISLKVAWSVLRLLFG